MPYILQKRRSKYESDLRLIQQAVKNTQSAELALNAAAARERLVSNIETVGDFNYNISYLVWGYFDENRSYTTADGLLALLEECVNYARGAGNQISHAHPLAKHLEDLVKQVIRTKKLNVTGTLRCVMAEFYARRVRPYEDEKINDPDNGDL